MRPVASCESVRKRLIFCVVKPNHTSIFSFLRKYRKSIVKNIVKNTGMVFDEFVQDKDEGSKLSDLVPHPIIFGLLPLDLNKNILFSMVSFSSMYTVIHYRWFLVVSLLHFVHWPGCHQLRHKQLMEIERTDLIRAGSHRKHYGGT
jgi:hypothetical protein